MPTPWSVGDEISADELNQSLPLTLTAGETINGATLPVACYMDDTDNELKACDGNDQAKLEFIGFAVSNSTDGNSITFQTKGAVAGFTGLDIGKLYYVQDDKTIGTTIGTYEVMVGIAISATQILIFESPGMQYCGSAGDSGDVITVPAVTRIAIVQVAYNDAGGDGGSAIGQITLTAKGRTSGNIQESMHAGAGAAEIGGASASWNVGANTITLSTTGVADNVSGTAYFYR